MEQCFNLKHRNVFFQEFQIHWLILSYDVTVEYCVVMTC